MTGNLLIYIVNQEFDGMKLGLGLILMTMLEVAAAKGVDINQCY